MIFCVEDDSNIRELVVYTLETTGFEAEGFEDGASLMEALPNCIPELILLDIMLPGDDGITILKKLKSSPKTSEIPIIMLTAKGSEYDKVIGLDTGADDYISKPFGMMELVSRIKAVLRRAGGKQSKDEMQIGPLKLDRKKHQIFSYGKEVILTFKEFELLERLMQYKGMVLSRDSLLEEIWGYEFCGETRTIDVHIRTLRHKLGEAGEMIETVRGVGYRLGGAYEA